MTTGIHHVTGLTRDVQANVDFYVGFLGLRLVKRTAGFEDAEQLHLFYGDAAGSPGSIISFLVWQDGGSGRIGLGQVSEIALAVPPSSIGDWLTRALTARIPVEGPLREMGETVLRLKDPDGTIVKLVGLDMPCPAPLPAPDAPTRLRSVTLLTAEPEAACEMLARFGYRPGPGEGAIRRMISDSDVIDIRAVAGFTPGIAGAGTIDHIALRAISAEQVREVRATLPEDLGEVNMHDRKYFYSLYVRDAGEQLYEYCSDAPGFTIDEPLESLGEALFTPPGDAERSRDLEVMLPQFALPGQERWPSRKLLFTHRHYVPNSHHQSNEPGPVMILLHGTGGNETSLLPLANRIDPTARLIGLRGRASEEGSMRWFRRFSMRDFDQDDIASEAEAFAEFIPDLARLYGFDPSQAVFLGHSNGANFLAAVMRLQPGLIQKALLLRAQDVLGAPNQAQPSTGRALLVKGDKDLIVGSGGDTLAANLALSGITADVQSVQLGHHTGTADIAACQAWLTADR